MPKLNLAIIHGIGVNSPGYSKDLTAGISREFNRTLKKILKTSDEFTNQLNFIEIVWDDILAFNQAKLADIFRQEFLRRNKETKINFIRWLGTFLILSLVFSIIFKFHFIWVVFAFVAFLQGKRLLDRVRSDFAAEFISDIIAYKDEYAYKAIQERILSDLNQVNPTSPEPISIVSHSLGTVIASNFIYDRVEKFSVMHPKFKLTNFFTMGSPLALFSLQFGPEMFKRPISLENKNGQWINLFDYDDFIGYPLKPLNEAYDRAVAKDVQVNTGWLGLAHIEYWKSMRVHEIIAAKLALDWLRVNNKLSSDDLDRLQQTYDKDLKI